MNELTLREYLQGLPPVRRGPLLDAFLRLYEQRLEAARVPRGFLRQINPGVVRDTLLRKRVEWTGAGRLRVRFDDLEEDEVLRRYENSIQ
jgi:hypothetical protein